MRGSFLRVRHYCPALGGLSLCLYASAALLAVLCVLLLGVLCASVDLLSHRGDLYVSKLEAEQLSRWAGEPNDGRVYLRRGVLPLAHQLQETPLGPPLRRAYRHYPWLQSSQLYLLALICASVVLGALACLSAFLLDRLANIAAGRVATRLRTELKSQVFRIGDSDVMRRRETDVMNLFRENVEQICLGLVAWWKTVLHTPLLVLLLGLLALALDVWLALAAILMACLGWMLAAWLSGAARTQRDLLAQRSEQQMTTLLEGLKRAQLISSYLLEDTPAWSFVESLSQYDRAARRCRARESALRPILFFVAIAGAGITLGIVGVNALRDPVEITFFQTILLYGALLVVAMPLCDMRTLGSTAESINAAANVVFEYLDQEPGVGQLPDAKQLDRLSQGIQIHDAVLRNPSDRLVLDALSIAIPANHRAAIVATDPMSLLGLSCLLVRFCDPDEGRVYYDGQDLRQATLESLRMQTALVLQDSLVFSGTVAENIACGDERFKPEEIDKAARLAGAFDLIAGLPQKFSTEIGEGGIWLDPQKQFHIGLARALLRDPSLLILQEPRTVLEPADAQRFHETLTLISRDRTVVVLASRLATVRGADRIYVIHQGKLHADGLHNDLVQRSELYRHLLYQQFGGGDFLGSSSSAAG